MGTTCDVVVVGGGCIGLAIADRLLATGRKVILLDAQDAGRGASWAASGSLQMIVPDVAPPLLRPLAARSNRLWSAFAAELEESAGMRTEFSNSGLLRLVIGDDDTTAVERTSTWLREHDVKIEKLSPTAARELAPIINEQTRFAYYEPNLLQVRPPRLLKALVTSVGRRGGRIQTHDPVWSILVEDGRVRGVEAASGKIQAPEVVLAAGAFAGELARRSLGLNLAVRPIRGEIVLLEGPHVRHCPLLLGMNGRYLIPRADGRILAGSTFEYAGFDTRITAAGTSEILASAIRLAPELARARVVTSWTGLRPESPDRLPYLGRVPGLDGLVVAAGHFRDGILLTPVTAEIIGNVLSGEKQAIDIDPFKVDRRQPDWLS